MIKLLFDSTIFLHQNNGGISRYISNLNDNLKNIILILIYFHQLQLTITWTKKRM